MRKSKAVLVLEYLQAFGSDKAVPARQIYKAQWPTFTENQTLRELYRQDNPTERWNKAYYYFPEPTGSYDVFRGSLWHLVNTRNKIKQIKEKDCYKYYLEV